MPTILVVDDDAHFRRLVSVTLTAKGYDVLEAARCAAGTTMLQTNKVDLIILDGLLPDGDGTAWVKQQRAAGPIAPVLFISAFRKSAKEQQALAAEIAVEGMLAKPITGPELLAKVDRLLQKHGTGEAEEIALSADEKSALAQMSAQYAADLPTLVAGLQQAVGQLKLKPREGPLQGVARRRAHQIAGTAGSFGFAEIGDACALIEQAVVALQKGGEFEPVEKALNKLVLADFPELG